jgi:hypothetical protein
VKQAKKLHWALENLLVHGFVGLEMYQQKYQQTARICWYLVGCYKTMDTSKHRYFSGFAGILGSFKT